MRVKVTQLQKEYMNRMLSEIVNPFTPTDNPIKWDNYSETINKLARIVDNIEPID